MRNNWFKISTNSQLAERWVKDSNECTATIKDENMSKIYAIIRSRTVMCFNDDARDAHIYRTRKATKLYTRGKIGERIDKQTGILEFVDDKKKEDIRGSMLIDINITRTIQTTNEVITMNTTDDVKDTSESRVKYF